MSRAIRTIANHQDADQYQPGYEPCSLSGEQKERIKERGDLIAANSEVDRVARNIATAMANPLTPELVRQHIRAYLDHHFWFDPTQYPEAIRALYPIACRRISKVPFIPQAELIEVWTGSDRQKAIAEAEADEEFTPHKSMSAEKVGEIVEFVLVETGDWADEAAKEIIALVKAIGLERDPDHRMKLVEEACRRAYAQTDEHRRREQEFVEQALIERIAS